jgi:hypothetical protein
LNLNFMGFEAIQHVLKIYNGKAPLQNALFLIK